jgi:PelA/Pel-15E family pectate lyase
MKILLRILLLGILTPLLAGASDSAPLTWGRSLLRQKPAWFMSAEGRAATDNILRYQSTEGGWPKNVDLLAPATDAALAEIQRGGKANTIDNQATTIPLRFAALAANATGEAKYRAAVERGIDYLLASQYPNGGFPQFYPLRKGYYAHITFNDSAMINAVELLRDVAEAREPFQSIDADRRARATDAVKRATDCILKTQLKQDGRLAAWCAQYDENTLEAAWARKYEAPSYSGAESVGIVRFLMSIEDPSPEIVAAIEGAVGWFRAVAIKGHRIEFVPQPSGKPDRVLVADPAAPPLWARFYELGTNRPLYMDRDSQPVYEFAQIDTERRAGYDYHGTWPAQLLDNDYPAWRARIAGRNIHTTP